MPAALRSWLDITPDSHFSLANIPFGIITTASNPRPRIATAIGDHAFDLFAFFFLNDYTSSEPDTLDADAATARAHFDIFSSPTLNTFAALGRPVTSAVRRHIQKLFALDTPFGALLRDNDAVRRKTLIPLADVTMHLPFAIGDYTDFYVGLHHATNCGRLMRGPGQELQPNYKHLPVGYHGRASSVVVSGTSITRPSGQVLPAGSATPVFAACGKLDFELELGCFVGTANAMGSPVPLAEAEEHLFGVVLMNDWSARDIQTWEMVPLGPFNAKNFGTSVSAWVVTMDALEPFLVSGLESGRELLSYLKGEKEGRVVDIKLEVDLQSKLDIRES
jgi:fumarylacetoacetase